MSEPPSADPELQFARLVVERGFARPEQVQEGLSLCAQFAGAGAESIPTLGDVLVKRGYLTLERYQQAMRLLGEARAQTPGQPPGPVNTSVASPAPPLLDGERIGKYIKARKLGAGAKGEVWLAWDTEIRRWVALKFLKHDDADDLARFKREAQTAGRLNHPGIAAIYEVCEIDGKHFIAMQYVEGQTLSTFPREDRKLIVELVRDSALAVHAAHEQGIIHRDLKPENMMVEGKPMPRAKTTRRVPGTRRAAGLRIYVMDFGLAKLMKVDSSLSMSGLIIGTPNYMPPEQAQGKIHELGAPSDVYALGATLYELLTDTPPFFEKDVYELLRRIVESDPRPLRRVNPRIEADLETIVLKCLEKESSRRYATALELADDLSRYLDGEEILAHPPSTTYRAKKFAKRHARVLVAAWIGLMAAVGLAAVFVPKWRNEARARAGAEAREREIKLYAPLERELDVLRMMFYKPDFALGDAEFKNYADLEQRVRRQMLDTGESAQGWYLIGRLREATGDLDGAADAYDRAIDRDHRHPQSLLRKGRLRIERAMIRRARAKSDEQKKGARVDAQEGAWYVRQGAEAAGIARSLDRDLAEAYVRLIEHWNTGRQGSVEDLMARWKNEPLAEEFLLVEGLLRGGDQILEYSSRVVRSAPSFAPAYFWRAIRRRDNGQTEEALADLDRALVIMPRSIDALITRALIRDTKGEWDAALSDLDRVLAIKSDFLEVYYTRGSIKKAKGDFDGAISDFDLVLAVRKDHDEAYNNRGNAKNSKGDLDGTISDFSRALALNPNFTAAYNNRATVKLAKGDVDGALADVDRALALNKDLAEAHYNRALVMQARGNRDAAVAEYDRALGLKGDFLEAYVNRGLARKAGGDLEGACADFDHALSIKPSHAGAYMSRGSCKQVKGDLDGAISDFDRAIALKPDYAEAYNNRGTAKKEKGDLGGALADYDRSLAIRRDYPEAWHNRGGARQAKGDLDGALADYDRALAIRADWAEAYKTYNNRALIKQARGDLDGAIADFDRALASKHDFVDAYNNRGNVRKDKGDLEGAIEDYDRALAIRPAAETYVNKGIVRYAKGEWDAAIADFNRAIALNKRLPDAYVNRAAAKRATGDLDGAIADCTQALTLRKDFPEAFANRALAAEGKGDLERAILDYKAALEAAPPSWPYRTTIRERLDAALRAKEKKLK